MPNAPRERVLFAAIAGREKAGGILNRPKPTNRFPYLLLDRIWTFFRQRLCDETGYESGVRLILYAFDILPFRQSFVPVPRCDDCERVRYQQIGPHFVAVSILRAMIFENGSRTAAALK